MPKKSKQSSISAYEVNNEISSINHELDALEHRKKALIKRKDRVSIYDYVDSSIPMLERMFNKREKGYKAMGYQIAYVDHAGS